jgi:hypothetical protein
MHRLFQLDGAHLLVPTVARGEIILRGSLVDLLIFALVRVPLKREAGLTHFAPIWVNVPDSPTLPASDNAVYVPLAQLVCTGGRGEEPLCRSRTAAAGLTPALGLLPRALRAGTPWPPWGLVHPICSWGLCHGCCRRPGRSACLRSQAPRRAPTEASGTYVGRRRVSL